MLPSHISWAKRNYLPKYVMMSCTWGHLLWITHSGLWRLRIKANCFNTGGCSGEILPDLSVQTREPFKCRVRKMLPIPQLVFICQSVWYPSDSTVSSGLRRAVGSQGLHTVCGLLLGEKCFQLKTRLTACIIYWALKPLAAPWEATSLAWTSANIKFSTFKLLFFMYSQWSHPRRHKHSSRYP